MTKFEYPIDLSDLEIQNVLLQSVVSPPSLTAAKIAYLSGVSRPIWCDGASWHRILPSHEFGVRDGWVTTTSDVATVNVDGDLYGTADLAISLASPISLSITGKATADAALIQTSGSTLALTVTELSVDPSEIALTLGYILVGDGSGRGMAVTPDTLSLNAFGPPTTEMFFGDQRLGQVADPIFDDDVATRGWVESVLGGVVPKTPVKYATAAALSSYTATAGAATVLTASAHEVLTIDGSAVALGESVLVKDETSGNAKYNGVYTLTTVGVADPGGAAWELTRREDANSDIEVTTGDAYFVSAGTTNGGTTWALQTAEPITLGTTGLTFVQTAGGAQYTSGRGIVAVGNTFHFAQSSGYTTYTVPIATGVSSIGFSNAPSGHQVFRSPGDGSAPGFGTIDISQSSIVTGVLQGVNGGTGFSSYSVGDLLYAASSGSSLSKLAAVAAGNVLISGTTPSYGKVNLGGSSPTHVTGTLQVTNGGLGRSSLTTYGVLYGNGTGAVAVTGAGDSGRILQASAGGSLQEPAWVAVSGDLSIAVGGAMTVGENRITFAKMQDIASGTVMGRLSAGSGDPREVTLSELATALLGTGTLNPTVTLTGDVTGSGAGTVATTISNLAFSKLANGSGLSVLGVSGTSAASVASITATAADQVFRANSTGTAVGFGAINLSGNNSTTGILPTGKGGTGTMTVSLFPTVAGLIPRLRKVALAQGSTSYTVAHGYGNKDLIAGLVNSSGRVVGARIDIDATNVVVTFGRATTTSYTLILVGSNLADPIP